MSRQLPWWRVGLPVLAGALLTATAWTGSVVQAHTKTTLTVWAFGGVNPEHVWEAKQVAAWNRSHPDLEVTWINQNWNGKREKLITAFESHQLPDIALLDSASAADLATIGAIRPLNKIDPGMVAKWKPLYVPAVWNASIFNRQLYSVPIGYVDLAPMLSYRSDLIHKAPSSWSQLLSLANRLKKEHPGLVPFYFGGQNETNDIVMFEGLMYQNGGRWISPQGKVVINGPGGVGALKLLVDLTRAGDVEKDPVATNYWPATEAFLQGKSAMAMTMSWVRAIESSVTGVKISGKYHVTEFPMPSHPQGSYVPSPIIIQPTLNAMVTTQSTHVAQDMEFINYMVGRSFEKGWWGNPIVGRVPAQKAAWTHKAVAREYPDLVKLYQKGLLFRNALTTPTFAGITQMENILGREIEAALLGRVSPQQALNIVEQKSIPIYAAYHKKH